MNIFIIGAGVMSTGIAQVFATSGHDVMITDISESALTKSIQSIEKTLNKLIEKEKITPEIKLNILSKINATTNLEDAKDAHLVIEAISEKIELKKQLFSKLDSICSDETIFSTNTSSLSITEIASATKLPERVIGMHFFNPAPVMKLV
ncbi:MAG: 3-hydroxyacyl-CoA dehydrogenase family protein, partial [Fusobacteriaceae bacterium]